VPTAPPPPHDPHRRVVAGLVCGALAVVLLSALALLPVPFAVESPGPVRNTLGTSGGVRLISVSGAPTHPARGSLDLTTVQVAGGPASRLDVLQVLTAWLSPTQEALPVEELYPAGATAKQVQAEGAQQMTTSQEDATAAALSELGIPVPTTLRVAGFPDGSKARGSLAEGDVVTSVDGRAVGDLRALRDALQAGPAGRTVLVAVQRAGRAVDVSVPTSAGADGRVVLGVLVDPDFHFPVDVTIQVDRIGGPSAGMMFALGIVDVLTPGSMTGGRVIAGTGTVDPDGDVGPIGGIAQKMAGAAAAGATAFLAPAADCDEVVGHVPHGLRVVRVATLHEARTAVEALGRGSDRGLPTCGG
jgi:Lon-like protease